MARPKTPLKDRVLRQSHIEGNHLIWNGPMRGRRPVMRHYGNPARVLLNLVDFPRISIRPTCLEPRCIEPTHWRVVKERDFKYLDLPPVTWRDPRDTSTADFTDQEVEEIQMIVEDGNVDEEELAKWYRPEVVAEILRRASATST
ncbi:MULTISPECIES: hypothetical protein [unclassified Mesorhizobium]|uniref:hypothetical protein n=1 Tax=unclassified Mesorhizobium TaxID=325217 RepID=UPI0011284BC9|nr:MULTISPECIES: hypothetical protein [unclassified Mesorhizobium]TPJ51744.1 hypothetical protein FJ426_18735 [Mesorhizobium sp. B2-6-4]TPN42366.1 hypothetical protein FJ979_02150 [Mesorhizobium sp. B1-1-6]